MPNVMMVVEYEGTAYHGFQVQPDLPTIQGELERAVQQITQESSRVHGAGRTDAGVHATGQVVNFKTGSALLPWALARAINAVLPDDIVVNKVEYAADGFHARFSASSRAYRYTILNREAPSALDRRVVYHYRPRLDVEAMHRACCLIVGKHDFACFTVPMEESTVREVLRADCYRQGEKVYVDIAANAFLPQMVRRIVGGLLWMGTGRWEPDDFGGLLRGLGGTELTAPTAPARGLCLTAVEY